MPKKTTQKRPIDQAVSINMDWWGKSFVFIKEKEVKSWQAIFAIAFLSGILATLIWSIPSGFSPKVSAQSVGIFFTPRTECRVMPPGGEVTASSTIMIRCGDLVTKANYTLSDGRSGTIVNRIWSSKDEYKYTDFVYASNNNLKLTINIKWHFWFFEIPLKNPIVYNFEAPVSCVDSDGGDEVGAKGTCVGVNGTFVDQCSGTTNTGLHLIKEAFCDSTGSMQCGVAEHICELQSPSQGYNSCFEGACVASTTTGNLSLLMSITTPPAQTLVMGDTERVLGEYRLMADEIEDIEISKMVFTDNTDNIENLGSIRNFRLMDGNNQISETIAFITPASTSQIMFNNVDLIVPKLSSKFIKLVGDVAQYPISVSSSIHTFGVVPNSNNEPITARGMTSGKEIVGNQLDLGDNDQDISIYANSITIYKTNVVVSWAPDSPSGSAVGGSGYTIAKINVSNYLNTENANALIKKLDVNLRSDIESLVGSSTRTLIIYKDSISSGNIIGRYIFDSSSSFGDTDIDIADTYIASGNTKTFIVTLDTQDAGRDDYLSVWMDAGDLEWSDGITSSINGADGLPLSPKTFRY